MIGAEDLDASPVFVRLGELQRPTGTEIRVWAGAGRVELREVPVDEGAVCEWGSLSLHKAELRQVAGYLAEVLETSADELLEKKPRRQIGFSMADEK